METIDFKKLKRNPDAIRNSLKIIDNRTVATKRLRVIFPERFTKKRVGLAFINLTSNIIGLYAILDDNGNYGVSLVSSFQTFKPDQIDTVLVNKEPYIQFTIEKDNNFILNNDLIQDSKYIFNLFAEFYLAGNIPAYYNYEDVSNLLVNSTLFNGFDIGKDPLLFEVITSIISRSPTNDSIYFKDIIKTEKDKTNIQPSYVGMNDIYDSLDDTVAKTIGGYLKQGLVNAIVDPENRSSDVSTILRS